MSDESRGRVTRQEAESRPVTSGSADDGFGAIRQDIVALLESARRAAARSVNSLMTASYWVIGQRIVRFEQGGQDRAAYGEALTERLSTDLTARFGRGFSRQNLWQMRAFNLAWPAPDIPQTSSGEFPGLASLAQAFPHALVRLRTPAVRQEHRGSQLLRN